MMSMANLMGILIDRYHSFRKTARRPSPERKYHYTSQSFIPPTNSFLDRGRKLWKYTAEGLNTRFEHWTNTPQIQIEDSNNRVLHHLQTQVTHLETSNGPTGYFSLPGEIRNKIMRHALTPGEVHLYQKTPEAPEDPRPKFAIE